MVLYLKGGSLDGTCHCGEVIQIANRLKVSTTNQQINLEAIGSLRVCKRLVNVVKLAVATSLHSDLSIGVCVCVCVCNDCKVVLHTHTKATTSLRSPVSSHKDMAYGHMLMQAKFKLLKACETARSRDHTRMVADQHQQKPSVKNVNFQKVFAIIKPIKYYFFTSELPSLHPQVAMACCGSGGKTDSPCWNPSMAPKNAGSRYATSRLNTEPSEHSPSRT